MKPISVDKILQQVINIIRWKPCVRVRALYCILKYRVLESARENILILLRKLLIRSVWTKHCHSLLKYIFVRPHFLSKIFKSTIIWTIFNSKELLHFVCNNPLSLVSAEIQAVLSVIIYESSLSISKINSVRWVSESIGRQRWGNKHNTWCITCICIGRHWFKLVSMCVSIELSPYNICVPINNRFVASIPRIKRIPITRGNMPS